MLPDTAVRFYAAERIFSVSIVVLAMAAMPQTLIFLAIVALGHAHFALSYYYRFKKTAPGARFFIWYVPVLVLSFFAAAAWPGAFPVFVGTVFIAHACLDDFHLNPDQQSRKPLWFLPVIGFIYFILLAEHYLSLFVPALFWYLMLGLSLITYLAIKDRSSVVTQWFLALSAGTVMLKLAFDLPLVYFYGFIILVHYLIWYIQIGARKWQVSVRTLRHYAREIALANIVFIGGLWIYLENLTFSPLYNFVYGERAFFVWTLLHILATLRRTDLRFILKK